MKLLLKSVLWTLLLPGVITMFIPWRILSRQQAPVIESWGLRQYLALIPLIAGAAVLLYSISLFSLIGRGTLSPADPPRHLVVAGMYRYVRNPMYVGVIAVLLGEALLFQSIVLLLYSAGVFLMFNLFVIFYEERALRRKFGESYEGYCRQVGRWLPRFTPYNESY